MTETAKTEPAREATTGIWLRRMVSLSLYHLLFVVVVGTLPLTLVLAGLGDLAARRRGALTRTLLFFALYLGCEVLGIWLAFGIWLTRGLWMGARDPRYLALNFRLQCAWARWLRRGAFTLYGMTLEVEGDEVFATGPVLVMARHSSVADTVLPVMLAGERHGLVLRWVLKRELLWDPCLDIVGHRLDNCFVSRMPEEGSADVARVAALMDDLGPGEGVMIYPEGTRFSAQKRRALLDKATKRGDETLRARVARFQHVLPPRLGGASALLARGTDLVFLAHVGLEGSATFWDLARGGLIGQPVRVKAWRIPAREVPAEPEARIAFLHDQWAKVDAFVGGEVGV